MNKQNTAVLEFTKAGQSKIQFTVAELVEVQETNDNKAMVAKLPCNPIYEQFKTEEAFADIKQELEAEGWVTFRTPYLFGHIEPNTQGYVESILHPTIVAEIMFWPDSEQGPDTTGTATCILHREDGLLQPTDEVLDQVKVKLKMTDDYVGVPWKNGSFENGFSYIRKERLAEILNDSTNKNYEYLDLTTYTQAAGNTSKPTLH